MKQFGGKASKELIERYSKSPNWKDGVFQNLEDTSMSFSIHELPKLLYKQFFETKGREPQAPLPVAGFDQQAFLEPSDRMKMIWYGHSAGLLRMAGKTVLVDPMLGPNASPIAPFATKRFSTNTLDLIDSFPQIDLLLLTHDHYDHLDMHSVERLIPKVEQYFVAIGTGRHLTKWGVDQERITEFDWWDSTAFEDLQITFTPNRHFSGRGINDRAKSLWGGWALKTEHENIYWSGDGGYGEHFKAVGERLGPFDFGIMECGQYNKNWHQIHMYPEESVQAALDAGVKVAIPVHWAGFALAQHHWKDPIERFVAEAGVKDLEIRTPEIGESFIYTDKLEKAWWNNYN